MSNHTASADATPLRTKEELEEFVEKGEGALKKALPYCDLDAVIMHWLTIQGISDQTVPEEERSISILNQDSGDEEIEALKVRFHGLESITGPLTDVLEAVKEALNTKKHFLEDLFEVLKEDQQEQCEGESIASVEEESTESTGSEYCSPKGRKMVGSIDP
ncbi:hypothetical protein BDV96DRAFT_641673 [Lophiotrema nucula]|uniref:Uncharacterized protein n=1 Tax=Lophiotrema nucula TaxID=690887 RepID=A0A6A5ZQ78_9PLEO|nr:hypothetical protein BDV96DRAFT_641673 [Lophiotrema nucula]